MLVCAGASVCACVRACVSVCVCVCVRACARACVRACVCVCVYALRIVFREKILCIKILLLLLLFTSLYCSSSCWYRVISKETVGNSWDILNAILGHKYH